MNKKDEIKIELISNIDEKIIEKQTVKRYDLLQKNRYSRKKLAGWGSIAACFVVAVSVLIGLLPQLLVKQAPIYQGMTVSNTMPDLNPSSDAEDIRTLANLFLPTPNAFMAMPGSPSLGYKTFGDTDSDNAVTDGNTDSDNAVTDGNTDGDNAVTDGGSDGNTNGGSDGNTDGGLEVVFPEVEGENRLLYYANKNEDIYITVHISNPESFEILSFTLNGVKYQSYMFESGSNSESLVLKVNVGDTAGVVEYTIDAIKYVDGTEIKDVRMDGERTVKVGVYSEDPAHHPSVEITDKTVGTDGITFTANLSDVNQMVSASSGNAFAYLYRGEELVASEELTVGASKNVTFNGLEQSVEYRYAIVVYYDSFDGEGFAAHCILEESFTVNSLVLIEDVKLVGDRTVAFSLNVGASGVSIDSVLLYNAFGEVERSADGETRSFGDLRYGTYTVKVVYSYGEGGGVGYVCSEDAVSVEYLGSLADIVEGGELLRGYYTDEPAYDPTTGDYRYHYGIDLIAPKKSVYAETSGKIVTAYDSYSYQGMVVIEDSLGNLYEYLSLDGVPASLKPDEQVSKDTFLGYAIDESKISVRAAFTGIVKTVSNNAIILTDKSGEVEILYISLENVPNDLTVGSIVKCGDVIGTTSSSYAFEVNMAMHVHVELRIANEHKNPCDYFKE